MKTEEARVTGKNGLLEAPLRGLKKASRTSDLKYYRESFGKLRKKEKKASRTSDLKYYRENFGKLRKKEKSNS